MKLEIGISTCPNDIFIFHGLLSNQIDTEDLDLHFDLADIQVLNTKIEQGYYQFAKGSFHAALNLRDRFGVMRAGAAIGFGVGPLLLASGCNKHTERRLTVTPGVDTTAHLLLRILRPELDNIDTCIFSDIMPKLARGEADFGVVIHEGRFTYEEQGLILESDLGQDWENLTGRPLPLGGLLGDLTLPADIHIRFNDLVRRSINYGFQHRDEVMVAMKKYAQELSDAIIWKHVDLYVNNFTTDIGEIGIEALNEMDNRSRQILNSSGDKELAPVRLLGEPQE